MTGLSAQVIDRRAIRVLSGVPRVSDTFLMKPHDETSSVTFARGARSFFQANRFLLETLVQQVATLVGDGPIVDLYAGVGLFGLSLAAAGAGDVIVVEGDPTSAHDLEENARAFGDRVRVVRLSVEDFSRGRSCGPETTVIVDPPRTGMSTEALAGMVRLRPGRIAYVSCDTATLARDSRRLIDAGYSLDHLFGIDLFPNTAHVETLCLFRLAPAP